MFLNFVFKFTQVIMIMIITLEVIISQSQDPTFRGHVVSVSDDAMPRSHFQVNIFRKSNARRLARKKERDVHPVTATNIP